MALDGVFLSVIAKEIETNVLNARVEKISQPSKEEIIISLRYKNETGAGSKKLLLSANANSPRIHFTNIALENPQSPPMFCMLLRKHLNTGRLIAVRQSGLDRVLCLDFEAVNELGDLTTNTVVIEIMGRHSNIILINQDNKIIDSIKRITNEVSSVRMVLPGMSYQAPPAQDKLNLFTASMDEVIQRFYKTPSIDVAKSIMQTLEGISPLLARELSYLALKGQDIEKDRLSDYYKQRIIDTLNELKQNLQIGNLQLTVCIEDSLKLNDFTLYDINQYGSKPKKTVYETTSALLDSFYADRDQQQRMKQRSNDLLKLLMNTSERITKKLALQQAELLECANRDTLKAYGDLINANIYRIEKGMHEVTLENFYEEACPSVTIKLDPRKGPAQNAQHYYLEYRKAQTAEQMLHDLMAKSQMELTYIDSVFDAVSRTKGESELLEIREELAEQGYIRATKQKSRMLKAQPPIAYRSSDGYSILCGRNNKQNDKLTLKVARNSDLWLHTQEIAGSHVIIETNGEGMDVPVRTITEAAIIAATNSQGRNSAQVAVDYTLVRYVKKPNGAKPGMVIFTDYYTAYVTPDAQLVESLRVK
ncbi:NFACT RNA binding domain-containing protein [Paludicola sp. MB14-C6]|uniref:Rqc2 family fibronectin-binding protein n=1 Tax=Paludihabitans sp. MB14-C6 TaxID=3070656 RepID=UPI0027DBC7E7|nr:NFACT RNA binding domain-containing protein [Paludicola sp. MB14-C6]WMJ23790.1 NFACT RNA binding domain-containing protein [Paludicola sp. MB14-C6]